MEALTSLMAEVRAAGGRSIADLAAVLLRFCRAHREALLAALDDTVQARRLEDLRRSAAAWFRDVVDDEVIGPAEAAELAQRLAVASMPPGSPVVAARATAEGLDEALGPRMADCFQALGERVLGPGDAFPVAACDLRRRFSRPNSRPESLATVAADGLRFVRLFPEGDAPVQVRCVWHDEHALANVRRRSRVAVAVPNAGLAEFAWDPYHRDEVALFFRVRARDPGRQRETVERLLAAAQAEDVDVLVLPELSVDAALLDAVRAWYGAGRRPCLLVAGSHHVEDAPDGGAAGPLRRNRAVAMLPHGEVVHHKFARFLFADADGVQRVEDIDRHPRQITLHLCRDWSFTVLICKDFLDEGVVHLLGELRVRMVLVPAFSEKTQAFEGLAHALTVNAQSTVVVANTPGADDAAVGIFARPTLDRALLVGSAADHPPPVVLALTDEGDLRVSR
jgi:predicted amidohydrolase